MWAISRHLLGLLISFVPRLVNISNTVSICCGLLLFEVLSPQTANSKHRKSQRYINNCRNIFIKWALFCCRWQLMRALAPSHSLTTPISLAPSANPLSNRADWIQSDFECWIKWQLDGGLCVPFIDRRGAKILTEPDITLISLGITDDMGVKSARHETS